MAAKDIEKYQIKKGEVKNPGGRGKGVPNSKTRMKRFLELIQTKNNPITGEKESLSIAEQMDLVLMQRALKGDIKAYQEIYDRFEGKVTQTIENIGDNQISIKVIRDAGDSSSPEITS